MSLCSEVINAYPCHSVRQPLSNLTEGITKTDRTTTQVECWFAATEEQKITLTVKPRSHQARQINVKDSERSHRPRRVA